MKARIVRAAIAIPRDGRTVERPGPGKAPTAFRIWAAGPNVTDHGTHVFTAASAAAILEAQGERGNLYSIDVDHLSLSDVAPPEARKAVGWMRLAVREDERGEPELWAVGVEWTDAVRAGLEKDPPEWRYFSPAYSTHDGEISRYVNTALTNNPATHRVTALATSAATKGTDTMTMEEIIAALQALADAGDENAKRMIGAAAAPEVVETAEPPAEEAAEPPADEKKADPAAATLATILSTVQALTAKVAGLEADKEKAERASLLASRPDFAPEVVTVLAKAPMALLRDAVKTLPRATRNLAAAAQPDVKATLGAGQGTDTAPRLPPEESKALREAMGLVVHKPEIKLERGTLVLGSMTAKQAREHIAARQAAQNAAPTAGKVA